jgi:adenosylhomocysteine nucleosidase
MQRSLKYVGICAATRWELQALERALHDSGGRVEAVTQWPGSRRVRCIQGSRRVTLIQTGVGPSRAAQAVKRFLTEEPCDLMISAGFACAPKPAVAGDVLIGTDAVPIGSGELEAQATRCDSVYQATALKVAKELGLTARWGRIFTAERVFGLAEEKQRAFAGTTAIGLDMESAAIGMSVAGSREVQPAFLIVRTVSDLADEDLPVDFNVFLRPSGWVRGVLGLMHPTAIMGLWRLRNQARVASRHLTAFFERFLHVVC